MKNYFKFGLPHPKTTLMYYTPMPTRSMTETELSDTALLFPIFHLMRESRHSVS